MESIFVLDAPLASLGFDPCILFFNTAERFHYRRPQTPVDATSGVACAPDNFPAGGTPFPGGMFRLTQLVDHAAWFAMSPEEYREAKARVLADQLALAERLVPGLKAHVTKTDLFTPRTIKRFTGHLNGNVYGSPVKSKDGTTPVPGVYVCGTDQGFLGIIGSLLSGVSIANKYFLK
jgi:phytoene dehydrogenase-like protein